MIKHPESRPCTPGWRPKGGGAARALVELVHQRSGLLDAVAVRPAHEALHRVKRVERILRSSFESCQPDKGLLLYPDTTEPSHVPRGLQHNSRETLQTVPARQCNKVVPRYKSSSQCGSQPKGATCSPSTMTDGMVRLPASAGMITGVPSLITATAELEVPKSMPMTVLSGLRSWLLAACLQARLARFAGFCKVVHREPLCCHAA